MSLMFMLFALVGAMVILGGGSYVLRTLLARMESHGVSTESEPPPRAGPTPHVGGYVPAPREPEEPRARDRPDGDERPALGP